MAGWESWKPRWGACVPVPSPVSQSVEGTACLFCLSFRSGSWLVLFFSKALSKRWSCFPSCWVRPSEWFGLNLASWKSLGFLCWTFWEKSSFALRSWQLSDNCCHQHCGISFFFPFIFWTSMYKRNMRGDLYHPWEAVQDVSTSNLCPIATSEI